MFLYWRIEGEDTEIEVWYHCDLNWTPKVRSPFFGKWCLDIDYHLPLLQIRTPSNSPQSLLVLHQDSQNPFQHNDHTRTFIGKLATWTTPQAENPSRDL